MSIWKPKYQDFQELFSNNHVLKILVIINQKFDKSVISTEISDILSIHISTAKKYLDSLVNQNFLTKEEFFNRPGKPTLYKLTNRMYTIQLDLDYLSGGINHEVILEKAFIRERPNLDPEIRYQIDKEGYVKSIVVKRKTKAKRTVTLKFDLNFIEKMFMKFLPHPTAPPKPFVDICSMAGISVTETKLLESFVKKLEKYGIIERI